MGTAGTRWWVKGLAAAGALSIGAGALTLFSSLGRRPALLHVSERHPLDSREFAASLAGITRSALRHGGTARLLNDGDEFFPAMLQAISAARHNVNFCVYIWEEGQVADAFLGALTDRARAGVQVRLLLDARGATHAPEAGLERLRQAGGRVASFRPARFGMLTRYHKRNHRRAVVVDGALAFTGGAAMADKWQGHAQDAEHWRDVMVEVTGPLAASVQSAFTDDWAHTTGEILAGPAFFPPEDVTAAPAPGPVHVGLATAPSSEDHPIRLVYMSVLAAARQRVAITTPYFVPDASLRKEMADRARGGVSVRVLLPDEHTDAAVIRRASQHYYEELLEAGVRIWEYQGTFLHAKTLVADGVLSVVGAANFDIRSMEHNHENVLAVQDASLAAALEAAFERDLRRAQAITLDGWRRRGAWARLKERLAILPAEQF
jgi:cardiolipin synthase